MKDVLSLVFFPSSLKTNKQEFSTCEKGNDIQVARTTGRYSIAAHIIL